MGGSKGKNSKGKGNDGNERWDDNNNSAGKGRNNSNNGEWWDNNNNTGKDDPSKKGKGKFYEENYTKGKNSWDNDNNGVRGKGKKRDNFEDTDGVHKRSKMDGLDGLSQEQRAM